MGRRQLHLRGAALLVGLQKPSRTEAPAVSGFEARKAKLWPRGGEIISEIFRKGEKFRGHHRADRMAACVLRAGIAGAIAEKTSQRFLRASREGQAKNVDFYVFLHVSTPAVEPSK